MKTLSRYLSSGLVGAWVCAAFFTWAAPRFITFWFTPRVSFGVNCEPAANWSMSKLVTAQVVGTVLGLIAGVAVTVYRDQRSRKPAPLEKL
jgi:hypothetical protein